MILWADLQTDIASCRGCVRQWPTLVAQPLSAGEIPNPPKVTLLFVGVAPTPIEGKNKGMHFYSSTRDPLRTALFQMLDSLLDDSDLRQKDKTGKSTGDAAFHERGLFFVHAAKIRPISHSAPPRAVMRFCARQHLAQEIESLQPKVVCFLGATNARPAAVELFGDNIEEVPDASLGQWRGKVVLAPQPVRAGKAAAPAILRRALAGAGGRGTGWTGLMP